MQLGHDLGTVQARDGSDPTAPIPGPTMCTLKCILLQIGADGCSQKAHIVIIIIIIIIIL